LETGKFDAYLDLLVSQSYLSEMLMLFSYRVLVTSDSSGLIETVANSISVHSLKKEAYARKLNRPGKMFTLHDYFIKVRYEHKWTLLIL
jgi:hypothetical protein